MRYNEVPAAAAYLVFHDAFDNGAMDVYLRPSLEEAEKTAATRNDNLAKGGNDDCGIWKAYVKLPRRKVFSVNGLMPKK
jgi:hypothetical protein